MSESLSAPADPFRETHTIAVGPNVDGHEQQAVAAQQRSDENDLTDLTEMDERRASGEAPIAWDSVKNSLLED